MGNQACYPIRCASRFLECETNRDAVMLAHNIAKGICTRLKRIKGKLPEDCREDLAEILGALDECFVLGQPDLLTDEAAEEFVDGLEDELIYQLHALYDWADYYRILITEIRR